MASGMRKTLPRQFIQYSFLLCITSTCWCPLGAFGGAAQTAQVDLQTVTPQSFEVAVIKTSDPRSPVANGTKFSSNRLSAVGSLRDLIELAYGVREFQIVEGPTWINSDSFDIDAKSEHPVGADQLKLMLRSLLTERFGLRLHSESRDVPLYALGVAKKAAKLREVAEGIGTMSAGAGWLTGKMTLAALAQYLTSIVGRTVEDRTGIGRRIRY